MWQMSGVNLNNSAHKHGALNCEICGGALKYSADGLSAVCPYCGNSYTFSAEKSEALALALNRANAMRIGCDFDGAIREYSLIAKRYPEDAEAHWGLALSRYGIEYVADPRGGRRAPACRRTVMGSILQDADFLAAVKYSGGAQAEVYKSRAAVIDSLQRDIKRKMEKEEDFDVFLCFRPTDDRGAPTRESAVARRIYDELTSRNIKTFFSELILKDKLVEDCEPAIFKALCSCKFFVLIACSEENINSPWVKNEWSRFRDRAEQERLYGACCAVYDVSITSLPPFIRTLHGINLAKYPAGGYETELANNLQNRFFAQRRPAASVSKMSPLADLLNHAEQDLNAKLYESAYAKYRRVLEIQPYSGHAWWGSFLAGRRAYSVDMAAQNILYEALSDEDDKNLKNAERYGDREVKAKVDSFRKTCEDLAAQCRDEMNTLTERLEKLKQEQEAAERQKTGLLKKLNKCEKSTASPKPILMIMGIAGGICYVIMTIIGIIFSWVLVVSAFAILLACLLAGVFADSGTKIRIRKAIVEKQILSAAVESADAQIESLREKIVGCEDEISALRRKEEAFLRVFSK